MNSILEVAAGTSPPRFEYVDQPLLPASPSPASINDGECSRSSSSQSPTSSKINIITQGPPSSRRKVTWLALASVAFFASASGPIGIETAVQAAGPAYTLIALAMVAMMWSVPQSMMSAELATMFAHNGGSVLWVESALGKTVGALNIYATVLRNIIDLALYPLLFTDYLDRLVHLSSAGRVMVVIGLMLAVFFLNIGSYELVGTSSIVFMVIVLSPYVIQIFLAIGLAKLDADMLSISNSPPMSSIDWPLFLNTLLWNMTGWDYLGCIVGEVHNPAVQFPLGVMAGVMLAFLNYAVPVAISAMCVSYPNWAEWDDGYFLTSLQGLAPWLGTLTLISAAVSILATASVLISASSRALWAAARIGRLPSILGSELTLHDNSKSPIAALVVHCLTTIVLAICGTFQYLLTMDSFLTCILLVLEMVAFLYLKWKRPDAERPYAVPGKMRGAWLITIPKAVVVVSTLSAQDGQTWLVGSIFCSVVISISWLLRHQTPDSADRHKMLNV